MSQFTEDFDSSPDTCRVPESRMEKRGSRTGRIRPFLYHLINGTGSPLAEQCSSARVLIGKVWFWGPWWIIGGGRESTSTNLIQNYDSEMPFRYQLLEKTCKRFSRPFNKDQTQTETSSITAFYRDFKSFIYIVIINATAKW